MTITGDLAKDLSPRTCASLLVVEDDSDVREALQLVLERAGYEVSTAANGREAIEALPTVRPALILLDLMMPVMSGFDFLEERERRAELAAIPVVVVSAYDRAAAALGGVAAIVPKPVKVATMLGAIEQHCGRPA